MSGFNIVAAIELDKEQKPTLQVAFFPDSQAASKSHQGSGYGFLAEVTRHGRTQQVRLSTDRQGSPTYGCWNSLDAHGGVTECAVVWACSPETLAPVRQALQDGMTCFRQDPNTVVNLVVAP